MSTCIPLVWWLNSLLNDWLPYTTIINQQGLNAATFSRLRSGAENRLVKSPIIAEACDVFEADALWNTAGQAKLDWTEICIYIKLYIYIMYIIYSSCIVYYA